MVTFEHTKFEEVHVVCKHAYTNVNLIERYRTHPTDEPIHMPATIQAYNNSQTEAHRELCHLLAGIISGELTDAESKVWHAHPVWFLDGNPIVGYSVQKKGIRLMFWSGADFEEENLDVVGKKFKDASIFYNTVDEVISTDLIRWLQKSRTIQWDYKNIVKRKGRLERII